MISRELAAIHRAAFHKERPWSAAEFEDLLANKFVSLHHMGHGFALWRTIAGESELLTMAVAPNRQGEGLGRKMLREWLASLQPTAEAAFLEVAADNQPAIHLYTSEKFTEIARRTAYYARKNAAPADAIIMRRLLTLGQAPDFATKMPESG